MSDLRRLQDCFDQLLELDSAAARAARLDELALPAAVRAQLEEMLAADAAAQAAAAAVTPAAERLPRLLDAMVAGSDPQARLGQRLGPFLLVAVIGQGGMGAVYRAERVDGEVHQQVAIKLITGPDPAGLLVARIESERRLLASLTHPGIARFLDAGRDAAGQPWLAMEYVEGQPLLEFARTRQLSLNGRLQLCIAVCAAVAYAHGRLVVHRDLKSSNVLVTAAGQPRLLDFGIARSLELDGLEATRTAERFLSPLSAAPEQLRGEPPSVAIDVYALGVLLFQLLAGRPPLELAGLPPAAVQRAILTAQPPLLGDAAAVSADPLVRARASELRGDLEQIVARCLRKQAAERYATVAALADDLGRFLRQEPVAARAPSLGYRSLRFVQRHRWPVAIASAVMVVLLGLSFGLWRQGVRLAEERDAQLAARQRADRISGFLVGLFAQSSPRETGGAALSARELLDRGLPRLLHAEAPHPGDAALLLAIAGAYVDLGEFAVAETALARASALAPEHTSDSTDRIQTLATAAEISSGLGRYDEALLHLDRAEQTAIATNAPQGQRLSLVLSRVRLNFARGEVEAAFAALAAARTAFVGIDAQQAIELDLTEGRLRAATGDHAAGLALLERGLAANRLLLSANDPALADTLMLVARAASYLKQFERVASAYGEARDIYARTFGEHHLLYGQALNGLGVLALDQRRLDVALPLLERALVIRAAQLGEQHPSLAASHNNLALVLHERGDLAGALTQITRAEVIAARAFPQGHFTRDIFALERGRILTTMNRPAEAASALWETRARMAASTTPQPRNLARTDLALAELCGRLGDGGAVRQRLALADPVLTTAFAPGDPVLARRSVLVDRWSADQQRPGPAHPLCQEPKTLNAVRPGRPDAPATPPAGG